MNYHVVVGLPVFNEASALPGVLEQLGQLRNQTENMLRVVVVNDGSTDETETVLQKYAVTCPFITCLHHESNRGLGAAIDTLFRFAAENFQEGDVLVTLDGDNTHKPKIIPDIVHKLKTEHLDVVIASRFAQGGKELGVSMTRKICSRGAKYFFKIFFPILNVSDYSSGYRCYDIGYLQRAMKEYEGGLVTTAGFECMAEILAKFSVLGVSAGEYPLELEYHFKRGRSKMNIARTICGYFRLLKKVRKTR